MTRLPLGESDFTAKYPAWPWSPPSLPFGGYSHLFPSRRGGRYV